jgi:RNA polymerase sigma-70 factor, ECF subfamily
MEAPSVAVTELVVGALRGERAAERQLYERHAPPLRRFALGLVRNGHDAADVVQETFARAFRLLPTLAEPAQFVPWLHGIAKNVSRECLKRRRRSELRCQTLGVLASRSPATPEHELMGSEAARLVGRTLARMPRARAEALLLRVERHLSYAEIASTLGWSLPKAKVEVHRARRTIAEALGIPTRRWLPGAVALTLILILASLLAGSKAPEPRVAPAPSEPLASMVPDASTFAMCMLPEDQCRVPEDTAPKECSSPEPVTSSELEP